MTCALFLQTLDLRGLEVADGNICFPYYKRNNVRNLKEMRERWEFKLVI